VTPPTDGEARAWSWVAHLRAGGTTPWTQWRGAALAEARAARHLPGAQQLELLRHLNLAGHPDAGLVERVLTTGAPGRGRPDLGLVGVLPEARFGAPPVDPAELPRDELVRVAASLVAEDVVRAGDPPAPRSPRRLRRRYRLLGDPELVRPVREALVADGRPPGGPRATTVVLGTDLATMFVHLWTARALTVGVRPWREWLAAEVRRPALPTRLDLAALADRHSRRALPRRVHVVLGDPRVAARLAGARRVLPAPFDLSADATELARRIAPVVAMLVPPERRPGLVRHRLRPVLAAADDGPPLRVPGRHRRRLREQSEDLRRRLSRGDYAVHGELSDPSAGPGVTAPDEERVLALAVRLLLEAPLTGAGSGSGSADRATGRTARTPEVATRATSGASTGATTGATTEAGEDT
jgi:hypothetical protein